MLPHHLNSHLAMDVTQKANSGYLGTQWPGRSCIPFGSAACGSTFNPLWPNSHRFVLSSNAHASMLVYATLYLAGIVKVKMGAALPPSLSKATDPARRLDGAAGYLCPHARLHWRRRGGLWTKWRRAICQDDPQRY
jgi:hypothetical protein